MIKRVMALIAVAAIAAWAGPNSSASISIDMNPATTAVDASRTTAVPNETFDVLVTAAGVSNLDTYTYRVVWDTTRIRYINATLDSGSLRNILATAGGTPCCAVGPLVKIAAGSTIDTLELSYTLIGSDPAKSPDGSGLLGRIQFQSKLAAGQSCTVTPIYGDFVDCYYSRDILSAYNAGTYSYAPVYTITASAGSGGAITPSGSVAVPYGNDQSFVVAADTLNGYLIDTVKVNGTPLAAVFGQKKYTYTFTNVIGNQSISAKFRLKTYQLSVIAGLGGTITAPASSPVTVNYGAATTITASPRSDSNFVNWTVISGTATIANANSASTTVTLTSGDATVRANFAIKTFQLSVTAGLGGTITAPASSPVTVNYGAATTITASPRSDSNFVNWTVISGTATLANSNSASTTVTLTSGDATVRANFAIRTFQLSVIAGLGGTITAPASSPVTVNYGAATTITASPRSDSNFVNWTVISGTATIANANSASTTVTLTSGDAAVRANFAIRTFQLSVIAGLGGTITAPASSPVTVNYGAATTITASPRSDSVFLNWTVTSGSATIANANSASTTVTLTSGDATVRANFAIRTFQLSVIAGLGGTITAPASSPVTVNYGAATTITASPRSDSVFLNWTVTSGSATIANANSASTTVTLTSGNVTVQANFSVKTYQLTVNAGAGGTITMPTGSPITVVSGLATTITAAPGSGYSFVNWTVTNGSAAIANPNAASTTITLTSGDATVQANFTTATYTLTLTVNNAAAGSVVPSSPATVAYGVPAAIAASANSGYFFDRWSIVSGSVTLGDAYGAATTASLTSAATVRADFVAAGSITVSITNGSGSEEVYLYAAGGWIGRKIRTGSGAISNLKPGNYVLAVKDANRRIEYAAVAVSAGAAAPMAIALRNCVQQIADTVAPVQAGGTQISAGSAGSPVMQDFDRDGYADLLIARASGDFWYYHNSAGGYALATGPQLASGGNLSWPGGIRCLRTADWNGDNRADLVALDNNGNIVLFVNASSAGAMVYAAGRTIYTVSGAAATGFDLADLNNDGFPDLVLGYADGSVKIANSSSSFTWDSPAWDAPAGAKLADNSDLNAGTNAAPALLEMSGDGAPDLVVGNGSGTALLFRNRGDGTWLARGNFVFAGKALGLSGSVSLSVLYGAPGKLPLLVMADGNGAVSTAQMVLAGDLNGDGVVDILDLQIFGDAWGLTPAGAKWQWKANLDLTASGGNQTIDVLDLAIFGDSWGTQQ